MTFSAQIGTLTASNGVTTLLCTLLSDASAPLPRVRVLRLVPVRPGRRPNADETPPLADQPPHPGLNEEGALTVTEHDRAQATSKDPVRGTSGSATLALQTKPTGQGALFAWDLTIATRVGRDKVEIHVLVAGPTGSFEQVAVVSGAAFPPAQLNAGTAQTVRTVIKPAPRLCVGLIQAEVPSLVTRYRGVTQGSGNAAQFGADPSVPNLEALLFRVFGLLDMPSTLDAVWDSEAGATSAELAARAASASVDVATADEVWARQITEMLVGVPYDSPMNPYNLGRGRAEKRLTNMPFCGGALGPGESNPLYGIPFACQQLATIGILSRGEYTSTLELAAASAASIIATRMKRDGGEAGKWFVDAASPREISAQEAAGTQTDPSVLTAGDLSVDLSKFIELPGYGPGAVHLFSNAPVSEQPGDYARIEAFLAANPPDKNGFVSDKSLNDRGSKFVPALDTKGNPIQVGGRQCRYLLIVKITRGRVTRNQVLCFPPGVELERDNQGAAHIGFAVRVRNGKAQFVDTGGLNAPGRDTPETQTLFPKNRNGMHGGTMDDTLGVNCRSLASPFRGVGTFGTLKPENASRLVKHVNTVLKRARPMGITRLYLLKPDTVAVSRGTNGRFPPVELAQVLYASPAKPMYDSDTTPDPDRSGADPQARNYSLARLAWSLRGLPDNVQAVWVVYLPLAPLVDKMMAGGRTNVLAGSDDSVLVQTKVIRGCVSRPGGAVTFVEADAVVPLTVLEGRGRNGVTSVPFLKTFAADAPPLAIPRYFQDA